ncbi:MAG TPA: magnesium transporter [Gammaproteobacteria bacterium]|nr:magnesium transporter [Gammaproteobacteria bacterium]|tara:strand:+ start:4496 stop:5854 length:1359 start_codon:yes stop_codon:yes gene_type:complete
MGTFEEHNRNQELVLSIQEALEANDLLSVRDALGLLHPSELADLLESLPSEIRDELWVHVEPAAEGGVLAEANDSVRAALLENMAPQQVAAATASLDSDDAADILQDLSESRADEVLRSMDDQNRARIASVLSYPEDTAGGLMNVDVVTIRADVDAAVVLRSLRLHHSIPEKTDSLMVVDRENTYLGVLALATLVSAPTSAYVGDLMRADAEGIPASTKAADVALLFEQRDLLSAAVVDGNGSLLGRITVDDVIDVISEQSAHSFMSAAGLNEEDDFFPPVLDATRRRSTWLAINLATAFLAAWVIGRFDATIQQLVALAILMPVVASMGGVAGSQTLTLVIRGLALGQVGSANARLLLCREMAIGVLNGLVWAVIVALVAGVWFSDVWLGVVIGSAIILNLVAAAFSGAVIPLILRRIQIDPALAGGVVLTTVTDVVGFVSFLGLATLFLL